MNELTCREVFVRLQDYLDRELPQEEIVAVEAHLAACGMCASEYKFEAGVLSHISTALSDVEVPDDLGDRLWSFIRAL
jgi:anti-sigma factor (TIGR02949 family)